MKPSDFPPPFDPAEFIAAPSDPEDERIEVGVLIVGAGPAGLACAIRLGQLLEDAPEIAERLGDVPVAVLEKGKQPGSHLLSGAVVNPRSLRTLFKDRIRTADMPFLGRVEHEARLLPDHASAPSGSRRRRPCGTTATSSRPCRSSGAGSRSGRRRAARRSCPRPPRRSCSSRTGACAASAPAIAAGAARASELANFEPGSDVLARVTVLAEGTQGHLTGVALSRLRAGRREPAGLGARREGGLARREAARPRDPHDGLASARRREVPRVRRLVHLPDGRGHGHRRDGRRARLPRRRALGARPAAGAEDASARAKDPRGRRADRVGREDDPRRRIPLACRGGCRRRAC